MQKDLKRKGWYDCTRQCLDLSNNWRMPTINELKLLYKNKHLLEGLTDLRDTYYWSSNTHYEKGGFYSLTLSFGNGATMPRDRSEFHYVRPVRTLGRVRPVKQ